MEEVELKMVSYVIGEVRNNELLPIEVITIPEVSHDTLMQFKDMIQLINPGIEVGVSSLKEVVDIDEYNTTLH